MKTWIKLGITAGALAVAACQERSSEQAQTPSSDQQGYTTPSESPAATTPAAPQQDTSGYGGSGDLSGDTATGTGTTGESVGGTPATPPVLPPEQQPGTGGSGDEGTSVEGSIDPNLPPPDTSDLPSPDENEGRQDRQDPYLDSTGTGGAGVEEDPNARTEGGTGTTELKPGETDARTGQTVPAPNSDFDSADGVTTTPDEGTTP